MDHSLKQLLDRIAEIVPNRYLQEGIEIPFPQRDVHIKSTAAPRTQSK